MSGYVFLYAGQGSQREHMGKDFYEESSLFREVIDSFNIEIEGKTIARYFKEGTLEELSRTKITQPCMAAFGAGVTAVLKEKGIEPAASCGLSLGEYGALHAAGVFDAKTYVEITSFRGEAMEQASAIGEFKMTAVLAMESSMIEEICDSCKETGYVKLVNYNCPGQYVIGGEAKAVEEAEEKLKEAGAKRMIPLRVSGPFHTKFMEPAAKKLEEFFTKITFHEPKIPVMYNCLGGANEGGESIAQILTKQVKESVFFEQQIISFLQLGYDKFIEIGPGNTLSGFVKKIAAKQGTKVTLISIDKMDDLKKLDI